MNEGKTTLEQIKKTDNEQYDEFKKVSDSKL